MQYKLSLTVPLLMEFPDVIIQVKLSQGCPIIAVQYLANIAEILAEEGMVVRWEGHAYDEMSGCIMK